MAKQKKIRVAINGFGRIGRAFFKLARNRSELEVVAINDLGDVEVLAYLLKYDSAYGRAPFDVSVHEGKLMADGKEITILAEKDPTLLPWKEMKIDVVVESTGFFTKFGDARMHITAGAKKVVLSAPAKDDPKDNTEGTILMGINDDRLATCDVTSNASCTTNAGSPLMAILDETLGIEKALLNTTHAMTASQSVVDSPSKKELREGRAASQNLIPTSTGSAIAVAKALPQLEGKFDGISVRVPVLVGSIADITFVSKRKTTAEEVNQILRDASHEERWHGIFTVTDEPLVSQDIVGNHHAAIADLSLTRVVDGDLVKVMSWYDNEIGYSNALVEHVIRTGQSA